MAAPTVLVHEVRGGLCVVCGDTVEWLRERHGDAAVRVLDSDLTSPNR